jgi:class 3 adenylate cyclase
LVARVMRQTGQALTAAHEKGVLHRDLKPENIMLQTLGDGEVQVKLIDFGIAAVKDSKVDHTQLTSKVAGTLSYMAPEQVLGNASPSSDLYALGVIAFEMVTGVRPENSPQGVLKKPRELRPELNDAAQAQILRALSYRPEQRQSRVREFTDQFAEALGETVSSYGPLPSGKSDSHSPSARLEMAYVLFMDLVDYSKLPMDQQTSRIQQLQTLVRGTSEFREASANEQLISLPTGDGMALVFFQNPVAAVECATTISRALRHREEIQLRMGVHTGPVYRIADINANHNVTGGGINLAQRVMDCGDAGHILLSKTFADVLVQLSDWADSLHDIGEATVKHGTTVHLVNLYSSDFGNPALPNKVAAGRPGGAVKKKAATAVERTVVAPADSVGRGGSGAKMAIAAAAIAIVAVGVLYFGFLNKPPEGALLPATSTSVAPTTPKVESSLAPAQPPKAAIGVKSAATSTEPAIDSANNKAQETATATATAPAPPAVAAEPIAMTPPPTTTPQPAAAGLAPRQGGGRRGQQPPANIAQALRQRVQRLDDRAKKATEIMPTIFNNLPQGPAARGVRQNVATAREEFLRLMKAGTAALNDNDYETAGKNLELAAQEMEKIETVIRRGTAPRGQ